MKTREYKFGSEARQAIIDVAEFIGDTLGKTLGPSGRNYLIPNGITNDGKTIARELRWEDEIKDLIAMAVCEILERQDTNGGDGTTTAGVIGCTLVKDALAKVVDIDSPVPGTIPVMEISRQLEAEKDKAIALLTEKVVPVTTLEQLESVAFTSMEDRDNAKIVAATIFEAGKDSFTAIDEGFTGKLETSVMSGIKAPVALAAPYMYTNNRKEAVYNNVPVLVVHHVFDAYKEISPFMNTLVQQPKANIPALIIVAKQFSVAFIQQAAQTMAASKFPIILISNSNIDNDVYEDIAAFCDAQLIDTHPKGGKNISEATFSHCGYVKKLIANDKETVFMGGRGLETIDGSTMNTRVQTRADAIKAQLASETSPEKRKQMERRIAGLLGGIATIYVDAKTATEKYYLKLKVEDTMNSCKHALEGGMVRGGGLSLKEVAEELGADSLLYNALKAPYERIQRNNGTTLEIGDDVMDSFLVAKAGIENAVSVVKILLTTEGVAADVERSMVEELKSKLFT